MYIKKMYVGPMFSGKSTQLMIDYEADNRPTKKYFKFVLGGTSEMTTIESHNGKKIQGTHINASILDDGYWEKVPSPVYLDEVHFIRDWKSFYRIFDKKELVISCLDMDYEGQPFIGVGNLMCLASEVQKCKGFCKDGNKTEYSLRIIPSKELFLEGAEEAYLPVCRECFHKKLKICERYKDDKEKNKWGTT